MSELAFNYKGRRFLLPKEAVFWSVERLREDQRGQLDVVRGPDGLPLILPLSTRIDEFQAQNEDRPGRYKLTPLDESKMELEGVPAAYVTVPPDRRPAEILDSKREVPLDARQERREPAIAPMVTAPFGTWPALPMPVAMSGTEYLLGEALRGQVQMFQMLTAALSDRNASNANGASQMMAAAAELVRAADGASMPHRRPAPEQAPLPTVPAATFVALAPEPRNAARAARDPVFDDEDDDELDDPPTSESQNELESIMGKFGSAIAAVGPAIPHLVTLVRGYPPAPAVSLRNAGGDDSEHAPDSDDDAPEPFVATPAMWSHMRLIHRELGDDGALFRKVYQASESARRCEILAQLCAMDLDDAVDAAATVIAPYKMRMVRRDRTRRAGEAAKANDTSMNSDVQLHAREETQREIDANHAGHERSIPFGAKPSSAQWVAADQDDNGELMSSDENHDDESNDDLNQETSIEQTTNPTPASDDDNFDSDIFTPEETINNPDPDGDTVSLQYEPATHQRKPATRGVTTANPDASTAYAATAPVAVAPPMAAVNPEARMMEIGKHLSLPEMLQARVLIGTLSAPERADWIQRLTPLAPADAAKVVRVELARRSGR